MSRFPAPVASRLAALAIALVPAMVLVRLVVVPLVDGDPGTAGREAIARLRAIAADRPRLERALAEAPPAAAEDSARFHQTGDALALADLQIRIAGFAAAAAVAVAAAEPSAGGDDAASPGHLALRLELSGTLAGLQQVVHAIDSSRPVMVITRFDLAPAAEAATSAGDPRLVARLTVAAWRSTGP